MEVPQVVPPDIHKSGEVPLIPPQVISLIGPELSGKSEQGRILAKRTGKPLIKMGEVFRELYKEDSDLARRAEANKGKYADDELFKEVFMWGVNRGQDYSNGFIIEGAPRALSQFKAFPEIVKAVTGREMPIKVAFLNVTRGHAYERQERREARADDALLDSRLDEHYKDLAEKISTVRGYAAVFTVVPTVVRGSNGEIAGDRSFEDISNELVKKLGISKFRTRTYYEATLTNGIRQILNLAEVDIDDMWRDVSTLPKSERPGAILAYMSNIDDELAQTSFTGDEFSELMRFRTRLEQLYAKNI